MSEHEAGSALNALIAERIFALPIRWGEDPETGQPDSFPVIQASINVPYKLVPPYSTEMVAAWPVAEKLHIGVLPWDGGYVAGYEVKDTVVCWYERVLYGDHEPVSWAYAPTAPLAIYRAALAAVGAA